MPQPRTTIATLLAGILMATFQLMRPWGDVSLEPVSMAEAFADPRWVIAHLAGAGSFVALAWLAAQVASVRRTMSARTSWLAMALGTVLVLPYFGAETFALHELGKAVVSGAPVDILDLAENIRMNLVALVLFGIGLVLIAVGGISLSLASVRAGIAAWGAWPLGVMAALVLPQFALPPVGRMAYGVVFLAASAVFAVAAARVARFSEVTATAS